MAETFGTLVTACCPRCGTPNSAGIPHSSYGEPCSGIPREPHVESHEAYHEYCRLSASAFAALIYVGQWHSRDAATDAPVTLLLGNCRTCHSTISRTVPRDSDEAIRYTPLGRVVDEEEAA